MPSTKKGLFTEDVSEFFGREQEKALKFKSLFVVGGVAKQCGKEVTKLVIQEKKRQKVSEDDVSKQIQSHWFNHYFCGEIDMEKLKTDAKQITETKLRNLFNAWRDCVKCRDDAKRNTEMWKDKEENESFDEAVESLGIAQKNYRNARTALLEVIAPKKKKSESGNDKRPMFDPNLDYVDILG